MTQYKSSRSSRPGRIAVVDIETISPPIADGGFPPWPMHSPVVASVLTATRQRYGQWQFALQSVDFVADSSSAIERVSHLIEGRTVISFFGRGFDANVLALTAMKHQRHDLVGISETWGAHRFSGNHYDVADVIGGYGAARGASLEMLCAELGIRPSRTATVPTSPSW